MLRYPARCCRCNNGTPLSHGVTHHAGYIRRESAPDDHHCSGSSVYVRGGVGMTHPSRALVGIPRTTLLSGEKPFASAFSLDPRRMFVRGRHIRALSHLVRAMNDVGRTVIVTTDKHGVLHFATQERGT